MKEIINIEEYKKELNKRNKISTGEDLFNIFLIYVHSAIFLSELGILEVNLNLLKQIFGRYKNVPEFSHLYEFIETKKDEKGIDIINFNPQLKLKEQTKILKDMSLFNKDTILIFSNETLAKELAKMYSEQTLLNYNDLMFCIYMDVKYGIDKWNIVHEAEYLKIPNYPGVVTGEFIGQEKNPEVLKKVKKLAREQLKREYEQ